MKNILLIIVAIITSCQINDTIVANPEPDNTNTQRIDDLIKEMTLKEKVGQMNQVTVNFFYKDGILQEKLLREYIIKYNIGSLLNTPIIEAISINQWNKLITKVQDIAKETRLKIPVIYGIDAIHGATYMKNSTLFPHNIGLAATRNTQIAHKAAEITAKEVRASGIRWNFDPVLGVAQQPLWPRFEETFGEDVLLVTEFGNATIKGYEGDDIKKNTQVASCMKHFIGYSVPLSGKDRTPVNIPDIWLNNTFMPPFKKAVESGSATIMINSGAVNGIPVHTNKYLLTDLLKNQWGFKGFTVTDWEDIQYLYTKHKVAKDNKEAVKLAINAGIDMSMVPDDLTFYNDLVELVNEGEVSMDRIDDAVRRILKVKFDLGLFDNPYPEPEAVANFGLPEYKIAALKSAQETITLLKNDSIGNKTVLPLNKGAKVLIAGPGANSLSTLHGSWSYTWDGKEEKHYPLSTLTIRKAIEYKIGKENIICISPNKFEEVSELEINKLVKYSKQVDYIVLCLGEDSYVEGNGNIDDLVLSKDQIKLAKVAIATKKPIITILTQGRPRIIKEIEPYISGIILAYRPGSKGAEAITDVLFGDYNPNGKLPFSYPKHTGNIITYDAPVKNKPFYNPQWEFGYGLSYTTFEYRDLVLNTDTLTSSDILNVQLRVTNTGGVDGLIAIDLFVSDVVATVIPPMKKLCKFKKIYLSAGESKMVEFQLNKDDLSFVNSELKTVTEDGEFVILIGDKEASFYFNN